MAWTQVSYDYDGSFSGFLSCVFESYVHREAPAAFSTPADPRVSLWPERTVICNDAHARRVYVSLAQKITPAAQTLVAHGFLTCMKDKELCLWQFIQYGYTRGAPAVRDLTDTRVLTLNRAVQHLNHEAHLLKGFLRFSEQDGVLVAEIEPKNQVLPLLRPHFCDRYANEAFLIYDRTHKEALFHRPDQWSIVPLEEFQLSSPGQKELNYRALWRQFYHTISIEDRYNPKCRMTHMPKRFWNAMTEFQSEPTPKSSPDSH